LAEERISTHTCANHLGIAVYARSTTPLWERACHFGSHSYLLDVARACNYHTRALRHVRSLLTDDLAQTVACSIVASRLDYCNAVLHGAPAATLDVLGQTDARPLLRSLHWLPVRQRVTYKMATTTFKVITSLTPAYLGDLIQTTVPARPLRLSDAPLLTVPRVRTELARRAFSVADHKHGTLSLLTLDPALPYRHLNAISKPTFYIILNWRHKRLCIPRKTLWRYTNVVLLLLLLLPDRASISHHYSSRYLIYPPIKDERPSRPDAGRQLARSRYSSNLVCLENCPAITLCVTIMTMYRHWQRMPSSMLTILKRRCFFGSSTCSSTMPSFCWTRHCR